MKRTLALLITMAVLVTVCAACSKSLEKMSATELLDLGEKYLLEMNYEKALIYFNKLIEVEPRNPRSYTGASEAYIGLSDAPPAVNVLKIGLESFPDDIELQTDFLTRLIAIDKINSDWYLRLAHIYIDKPDTDSAIALLNQGIGVTDMSVDGKVKLQELLDELIYQEEREESTALAVPILGEIAALCATESYDAVFEKMQSEEFGKVTALVDFLREPFISETPSGRIGVYGVDSTTYGNYMLYYGDYLDDVRNGNGLWFGYYEGQNYFAKGSWQDDKPDGEMTIKEWNSGLAENVIYRIITGSVVNGLWNGDIIWSFERDSELTHIFPVKFEMGHWVILEVKNDNDDGKTRYIVSKSGNTSDNNTGVMSTKTPNELEGVIGFIHE
ncbi:hypothetical protein ABFV83_11405 [Lacrimispora sp. BS-2]|uniref:Tetratricopeptide repeat protein n=1 Tax=Lacrimispora sp. BS-2 TaxID=3151850 RepID=A0AAU7PJD9_9FIRM